LKIDLHLHTIYGSACAYMDPDQLIEQAKKIGLDGICITEHDQVWSKERIEDLQKKHDFLVIGGVEVSTDWGEILVYGLHESVLQIGSAKELKRKVDEVEGVMVLAHPFRLEPDLFLGYSASADKSGPNPSKKLIAAGRHPVFKLVDAMEVYNGRSWLNEADFTTAVADNLHLKGTGGSDAHAILDIGACYTVFEDDIRNEKDFIACIKEGRFCGVDGRWIED